MKKRYSDEELLNIIKQKAEGLGRTPKIKEVGHQWVILDRFSNYNNALKLCGLIPNIRETYTKEELLNIIKDKCKELGRTPRSNEVTDIITSIKYHFGTWNKALEEAQIDINIKANNTGYNDEELIEIYINLCNKLDKFAESKDIYELGFSPNVFANRFKDLETLRNIIKNDSRLKISNHYFRNYKKKFTEKQMLEYVERINNDLDSKVNFEQFNEYLKKNKLPHASTICRYLRVRSYKDIFKVNMKG
jgi:hypothetical protein